LTRFVAILVALLGTQLLTGVEAADALAEAQTNPKLELAKPVEPSDAVATLQIADGLRVEIVAAEPLVRDPIAITFDESGNAYVAELAPYNAYAKPDAQTHGTVCRLTDTDGDGRFDQRTEFATDLTFPTGLLWYDGGLLVGDAPDLKYLRDADSDGRADSSEVLLTGFGSDHAGEGQLNSFYWGLDNRIYISTGQDGGRVRAPHQAESGAIETRNRTLVFDPQTKTFELTSGGGQYGMGRDDWGQIYVCQNSLPVMTLMYDDRYIERNPHMTAPPPAAAIHAEGKYARLFRQSPPESWRVIRTQLRKQGKFAGPVEEGRISGFFTAAAGVNVYRGDALPPEYQGNLFVGEAANNLVHRAQVTAKPTDGIERTAKRIDQGTEFIAGTDTWFRPVQIANAPDGSLYVLDMYRELIEGAAFLPPQLLAQMDPLAGSDRGRIYRVVPAAFKSRATPNLATLSTSELVPLLAHPNGWRRDTAARLIFERQDTSCIPALRVLASKSNEPLGRLHALYALSGLNMLTAVDLLNALADTSPGVRQHALRLSESMLTSSTELSKRAASLATDSDPQVRYQLAFSSGHLDRELRDPVLIQLLQRDGQSVWMRVAAQSSLGADAAKVFGELLNDNSFAAAPHGQEFLQSLAVQSLKSKNEDLPVVVAALDRQLEKNGGHTELANDLISKLLELGPPGTAQQLAKLSHGGVRKAIDDLMASAEEHALDDSLATSDRIAAIQRLAAGGFATTEATFDELLSPSQPPEVQDAALRSCLRMQDDDVAALIIDKWSALTPSLRATALGVLCSRQAWTEQLLTAMEAADIPTSDVDSARASQLTQHTSATIRDRATKLLSGGKEAAREEVFTSYQSALLQNGNVEAGRAIFRRTCASCHELDGVGTQIGADLHAVADRGSEAVMLNILDPNREVKPQFVTYVVLTTDGVTVSGMIAAETANELTFAQSDGTRVTIPRSDIDEMTSTGKSLMPDGLEREIDIGEMADLLAYLKEIQN
jgi:putative membrane-bound dehydrogenase-like protein